MSVALPRLLSPRELADQLGQSRWTIYDLTKRGLPHIKLGRIIRYDPEAVRAWLDAGGTAQNGDADGE